MCSSFPFTEKKVEVAEDVPVFCDAHAVPILIFSEMISRNTPLNLMSQFFRLDGYISSPPTK